MLLLCPPVTERTALISKPAPALTGVLSNEHQIQNVYSFTAIFFPRVILHNFFLFCLIYGGLGFGVLGSYIGFLGLGFSVHGVWGLWCGAF